jgi:predicted O-methyltransferase YrrM
MRANDHDTRGNAVMRSIWQRVKTAPIFRPLLSGWFGTKYSFDLYGRRLLKPYLSILRTGEFHNFTYALTPASLRYLAATIAVVTGRPLDEIVAYIQEPIDDEALLGHIAQAITSRHRSGASQSVPMPFGRRLGWYAIARVLKPKIVVETGVERGHGSVLLCSALMRNASEGHPGRYYGTDIDPNAGFLLSGRYKEFGEILYGDSIDSLKSLRGPIDLFINDSEHSVDYEAAEYQVVRDKLAPSAIVLGDNAHVSDNLAIFAAETGRKFLFFKEVPSRHWYPGAGIGIAFR